MPGDRFVCPICQKEFARKISKDYHVLLIHEVCIQSVWMDLSWTYRCSKFGLLTSASLQNAGKLKCGWCDKTFRNKYHLEVHERTHTVECKLFSVLVLGGSGLIALNNQTFHFQKEKPFVCKNCKKRFAGKGNLKIHYLDVHAVCISLCDTPQTPFGR